MQTVLPTAGPGSLQSREDPSLRSGKVRPLIPEKFYHEFQLYGFEWTLIKVKYFIYTLFFFSMKNVTNLGPATDFYKKLALECSAQQVAVDLFMLNGQYTDIASICKYLIETWYSGVKWCWNLHYVMISMYKDHVDFLYFQLVYPSILADVSITTLCSMLLKTRHWLRSMRQIWGGI